MKQKDLKSADAQMLAEWYRTAAIEYGAAVDAGERKTANRAHDRGTAVATEMRRRGPSVEAIVQQSLLDANPWVAAWSAIYCLQSAPRESEAVLKELADGLKGFVSITAMMALERWHKGELRFPQ